MRAVLRVRASVAGKAAVYLAKQPKSVLVHPAEEASKAEAIVEQEIGQFHQWLGNLEVKPTVIALRQKFEEIRRQELEKTFSNLKDLSAKQRKSIEAMAGAIINKVLHQPTAVLKRTQNDTSGEDYVDAVRALFDLPAPADDDKEIKPLDDSDQE